MEVPGGKPDATTADKLDVRSVVVERTPSDSEELGSTLVGCRSLGLTTADSDENGISRVSNEEVVAVCD